jgi:hypothetical protein
LEAIGKFSAGIKFPPTAVSQAIVPRQNIKHGDMCVLMLRGDFPLFSCPWSSIPVSLRRQAHSRRSSVFSAIGSIDTNLLVIKSRFLVNMVKQSVVVVVWRGGRAK